MCIVKEHYDNHLGNFYAWMAGDFDTGRQRFQQFLSDYGLEPKSSKIALDLGAGHGIQSVALAQSGYSVKAIDFSKQLLDELETSSEGLDIETIEEDIRFVGKYAEMNPELIICWGDTLTHLDSKKDIEDFVGDISSVLPSDGIFLFSFRDYSEEVTGTNRFIPVKSDQERILTCFLEYKPDSVQVTDLLYEKENGEWAQKVSSYEKVRITHDEVLDLLGKNRMNIQLSRKEKGIITIIASKKPAPKASRGTKFLA